ncbi:MAG: hypothetical protein ETSY2_50345, partial [Candidatus Entotheonella gemina]
ERAQLLPPLRLNGAVHGAELSSDNAQILSWSVDGMARLWDLSTGEPRKMPWFDDLAILGGAFDPDGARVLTWGKDGTIRLWDRATEGALGAPLKHEKLVLGARFDADGRRVLTWGEDRAALWDIEDIIKTGATRRPLILDHGDNVRVLGAVFSPQQDRILTWSTAVKERERASGNARLWDSRTGEAFPFRFPHQVTNRTPVFSPDSQQILTWMTDRSVRLWDRATGTALSPSLLHRANIIGAEVIRKGRQILTWGADGSVRLWDRGGLRVVFPTEDRIQGVSLSPDGDEVLTWNRKGAQLWNNANGKQLSLRAKFPPRLQGAVLSANGRWVFAWSRDRVGRLWDRLASTPGSLSEHPGIKGAVFRSDSQELLSWDDQGGVQVWNLPSGKSRRLMAIDKGQVLGARYSPDKKRILTWSDHGTVQVWNRTTGQALTLHLSSEGTVKGAMFCPKRRRILTWHSKQSDEGEWKSAARVWDGVNGEPMTKPLRQEGKVKDVV